MSQAAEIPHIELPKPDNDQFLRERWAFYCLLGDLLKTHKNEYVAIVQKRPVAFGKDSMDVVRQVYERFGNVPMYVGLVSDEPPPIERVPRFRPGT